MVGIGASVGNYIIKEKLGEGGMGTVWLAEHPLIGSRVAIKVIKAPYGSDPDSVSRFFTEAQAVNRIRNHHIVDISDFGKTAEGESYCIMELLAGESLSARLAHGPLPLEEVLAIAEQVADALAAAHERGILHRDLKPDNVFVLERDGRPFVKVLDFGLAKLIGEATPDHKTQSGALIGTPFYMSPEQCLSEPDLDERCDVYALGVLLYQMVCGEVPFTGRGYGEILLKHSTAAVPSARALAPDCPPWLDRLIQRAMAKRREERVPSMRELRRLLRQPAAPASLAETLTPESMARGESAPRPASRRWLWLAGALVAGGAAALVVWLRPHRQADARQAAADAGLASPADDARAAVTRLALAQAAAMAAGDGAALEETFDPALFRFGTDAGEVFSERKSALAALARALDRLRQQHATMTARPSNLAIGLAPGGKAAWLAEDLDWAVSGAGKDASIRYLVSQLAVETGGRWRVIACHWSRGVSDARARAAVAAGTLPQPAPLPAAGDPAAAPVALALTAALADKTAFAAAVAAGEDTLGIGSSLGERDQGGAAVRRRWAAMHGDIAASGAVRAGLAPGGQVGWAASNVDYRSPAGLRIPYRLLAVLVLREGRWQIVLAHLSNGGPVP